ncbi:MAG: lysophospholipid acyltransferase family protein [Pseudomonadota bacterium]|nr:lysophospholipid acyltransferase family protein [Pseudomonadota bacterium]
MQSLRAAVILFLYVLFTLPLMPVQALLVMLGSGAARTLPHWYHRKVCRLFNVRLHLSGAPLAPPPVLFVCNHVSWLDISVLSAVAPVSFIAKSEVARWPWAGWLAKLQRTVFVDRRRPYSVGNVTREVAARLRAGDRMVLFAEGTSNDGNLVLPFRTALFAAAMPVGDASGSEHDISVQTLSIAYTHLHGVPMGRRGRPHVAWYGGMEMAPHIWDLLRRGPLDVHVEAGSPLPLDGFADRKELARQTEGEVRRAVSHLLMPRRPGLQEARSVPETGEAAEVDAVPFIQ